MMIAGTMTDTMTIATDARSTRWGGPILPSRPLKL
jgi:hypothetical protein